MSRSSKLTVDDLLTKKNFSRENTILKNYYEETFSENDGIHSEQLMQNSRESSMQINSKTSSILDKEDTMLIDISPENTILNGTQCQKLYIQACKMLKIPPSDLIFESFNKAVFRLEHRYSNEDEVLAVAIGIAHSHSLVEVHFVDNQMSNKSVLRICAAVWENESIITLEICDNPLSNQALSLINNLVKEQSQLKRLALRGCNIVDPQGTFTPPLLNHLNRLNLSYNRLEDSTIQLFSHNLVRNEILKELDLSWNCIRTKGAGYLCKALLTNKTLTNLNIRMNGIGSVGANYFSELLTKNKILVDVDISSNRIFDNGFTELAKVFSKSKTINRFGLGNNPVSTKGVRILLEALESNKGSVLEALELHGVYIEKSTQNIIDRLKIKKPKLKIILTGVVTRGTELVVKELNGIMFPNPLEAIRFHIETTGSRLLDFFRFLDRRNTNRITRRDFVACLHELKYPYSEAQIDDLMEVLDPENTGEVNFAKLAEKDYEVKKLNRKRREKEKQKLAKEVRHSPQPSEEESDTESSHSEEEEFNFEENIPESSDDIIPNNI